MSFHAKPFPAKVLYRIADSNTIMETVMITKEEYERFKKLEELDYDLMQQFSSSLQDLRHGRFKRLA